jgi:DNA-binding MarR family transcriptional regulator
MRTPKTVALRTKKTAGKIETTGDKPAQPAHIVKKTAAAKPIVRIGVLVHDVARMRKTIFDQAVKEMGITRAQWWALSNLSRHKTEGMNQSDLARALNVGKPTIGGLIDRLTEKGMVERRSHGDDRRVKNIYITDHGYDLIHYMSPIAANLNTVFLEGIPDKDIRVAEAVLQKLKDNLELLFESGPNLKLPKAFKAKLEAMRDSDD